MVRLIIIPIVIASVSLLIIWLLNYKFGMKTAKITSAICCSLAMVFSAWFLYVGMDEVENGEGGLTAFMIVLSIPVFFLPIVFGMLLGLAIATFQNRKKQGVFIAFRPQPDKV